MNLFEAKIVLWIQENLRFEALTPVMKCITALGNSGVFWIVLTLALLAVKRTRKIGLCCALALIFDLLAVNITLKPLVARIRPYDTLESISILVSAPHDYSFPSGHSAVSFACAWALFRSLEKKPAGICALVLAALIAWSRLYVGVHYPSDVILGAAAGILVAEAAVFITGKIIRRTAKKTA